MRHAYGCTLHMFASCCMIDTSTLFIVGCDLLGWVLRLQALEKNFFQRLLVSAYIDSLVETHRCLCWCSSWTAKLNSIMICLVRVSDIVLVPALRWCDNISLVLRTTTCCHGSEQCSTNALHVIEHDNHGICSNLDQAVITWHPSADMLDTFGQRCFC